jgi:hypothetical protein
VVFSLNLKGKRSCRAERDEASLYKSCYLNMAPGDGVLRDRSRNSGDSKQRNRTEKENMKRTGGIKQQILKKMYLSLHKRE